LEKKTQHYLAIRIAGKTREAVNGAMAKLREKYGARFSSVFKTITVDNGSEFSDFTEVVRWGTKVYYAHPYTSWEQPQNERHNGMLRSYVHPKVSPLRSSRSTAYCSRWTKVCQHPKSQSSKTRRPSEKLSGEPSGLGP